MADRTLDPATITGRLAVLNMLQAWDIASSKFLPSEEQLENLTACQMRNINWNKDTVPEQMVTLVEIFCHQQYYTQSLCTQACIFCAT